jgi:hypothetical protein
MERASDARNDRDTLASDRRGVINRAMSESCNGDFVSVGLHESGTGLQLRGLGLIPLPINEHIAAEVDRISRSTRVGGTVPSCIVADASLVSFSNPSWGGVVPNSILEAVRRDLDTPSSCSYSATLYKLIIWGKEAEVSGLIECSTEAGMCQYQLSIFHLPCTFLRYCTCRLFWHAAYYAAQ